MSQLSGQIALSDTVATQFTSVVVNVVAIKAHPSNTSTVWIGDTGAGVVTVTTGFPLNPGETIVIAVDGNLDKLYGIASVDAEKVTWIDTGR